MHGISNEHWQEYFTYKNAMKRVQDFESAYSHIKDPKGTAQVH